MFSKLIVICVIVSWSRCEEQKKYAISFASVNIQKNLDNEGQPVVNSTDEDESYNYINYHVYTPPRKQPVLNYHPESVEKFNKTFVDNLEQLNNQLENQYSKHEENDFKVNTNAHNQVFYKAPQGRHTDINFRNLEENYNEQNHLQNHPRKPLKPVKYTNVDTYNKYAHNGEYVPEENQQNKYKQSSRVKEYKTYKEDTAYTESKNNLEDYKTRENNYSKQLQQQKENLKGNKLINPILDPYNKEKYEADSAHAHQEPKNKKRMNIKYGDNSEVTSNQHSNDYNNYNQNAHDIYYKPKVEKQTIKQDKHQYQEYYSTTSKPDNFHVNEQHFNEQDVYYRPNNDKKVAYKQNIHKYTEENVYFKPRVNDTVISKQSERLKAPSKYEDYSQKGVELDVYNTPKPIKDSTKQTDNKQYYVASTAKYTDDYYYKDHEQKDKKVLIKQPDAQQQHYKDYQQQGLESDFRNVLKHTDNKQFYVVSTPKYTNEYHNEKQEAKQSEPQQYLSSTVRYNDVYTSYEQLLSTVYKPNSQSQLVNDQTLNVYKLKQNKPSNTQPEKQPTYLSSTTKYAEDDYSKMQDIKPHSPSTIKYIDGDFVNEPRFTSTPKKEYNAYEQHKSFNQDIYRKQPEKQTYMSTPKYMDTYFENEQRSTSKYNDYNGSEQPAEVKNVNKLKIYKQVIDKQPDKQQVYLASTPKYNDDYFGQVNEIRVTPSKSVSEFLPHEQLAEIKNYNKSKINKEALVKQPIILSSTPRYQIHLIPSSKYNDEYSNNEQLILPKYNTSHNVPEPKTIYRPKTNKEPAVKQADKQYSPSTLKYYGNEQHLIPSKTYDHGYEDSYKSKHIEQTTKRQHLSSTANYNDNYYANEHLSTNTKVNDDYSTYDLKSENIFSKAKKNKEHHGKQEEKKRTYAQSTIKYSDDHFGNEQLVTKLKPISHDFSTYEQPEVLSFDKIKQIKEAPSRPVHKTPVYLTATTKYNENYFTNEQHSTASSNINNDQERDYIYNTPKRNNKENDKENNRHQATHKHNDNYLGNDQYINNQDDVFYKPTQNFKELYKPNKIKQELHSTPSPVLNNTYHDNQHTQDFAGLVYYKPENNIKQINKPLNNAEIKNNEHYIYEQVNKPKNSNKDFYKQTDNKQQNYKYSEDYQSKQPSNEGNIYYKPKVKIISYNDEANLYSAINTNNTYNVHKDESVYFKPTKQTRPVQKYTQQIQDEFQQVPFNNQYNLNPSKTIDNYQIPDQVQQNVYHKPAFNKLLVENQPSRDNGYDYKYGNQNEEYAYKATDNFNARVYPSAKSFTFQKEPKNEQHLNDHKATAFTYNEKDKQQTDRDKIYSDIDDSFFQ